MNQRIRELAEQANLTIATSPLWEHKVQEFAQLIVRECAGLCSDPVVILQHWGIDSKSG